MLGESRRRRDYSFGRTREGSVGCTGFQGLKQLRRLVFETYSPFPGVGVLYFCPGKSFCSSGSASAMVPRRSPRKLIHVKFCVVAVRVYVSWGANSALFGDLLPGYASLL